MSTQPGISASAGGYYEPVLTHTFLPRCPHCAARGVITPHPKAANPAASDTCPACGQQNPSGPTRTTGAVLTGGGPLIGLGKTLLAAGKFLAKLSQKG